MRLFHKTRRSKIKYQNTASQMTASSKRFTPSVFCLIFLLFLSCKTEKKCKYGKPIAIFNSQMPTVKKHFFEVKKDGAGEIGVEMVAFDKNLLVEIEQTGCQKAKQQFTFILAGKFQEATDDDWKDLSISFFRQFAQISPDLTTFGAWAEAIEKSKDKIRIAEAAQIEYQGFAREVRIDKIVSPERATLVVQLSE